MRHNVLALALLAAGPAFPSLAEAFTHEVTQAAQLDTLIGTATLPGTAHGGDRIHINRGDYIAPTGGWKIRKPLEIFGDGAGNPFAGDNSSTWLQPASSADSVLVIDISQVPALGYLPRIYIHDLAIGQGINCSPNPNSNGIIFKSPGQKVLLDFRLARVSVFNMGNDGIHLEGADTGTGAIVGLTLDDVTSTHNCGDGLEVIYATVLRILGGSYSVNAKIGASIRGCSGAHMIRNTFEENQTSAQGAGPGDVQLFLETSHNFLVTGAHFENFAGPLARRNAIGISGCLGGFIGSSGFGNASAVSGSTGILLWTGRTIVVGQNTWSGVDVLFQAGTDSTTTSCVVMPQTISDNLGLAAKIVIPELADRGHIVMAATGNISNLTAGIELPRLSLAKRDGMTKASTGGSLREGLVVYNDSTNTLNHFDGSWWRENAALFPSTATQNAPPAGIVLPAIITSTSRESIPAAFKKEGTLFYNVEKHKFNYWNGTTWKELTDKTGTAP